MKYIYLLFPFVLVFALTVICGGSLYAQEGSEDAMDEALKKPASKEATAAEESKEEVTAQPQVLEIAPLEDESLYSIELRNVDVGDFFRVVAHDYKLNIVVDKDTKGKITASFTNVSLDEALDKIAEMNNLLLEKKGNIITVKPNLITKMFTLKHINVEELLDLNDSGAGEGDGEGEGEEAQVNGGVMATIYDLLSDEGKILLGKQLNSIVVIDYPPNIAKVEHFLEAVDQKMSTRVIKLQHISVKDLFPDLVEEEREERKKQRDERQQEREELKELRERAEE